MLATTPKTAADMSSVIRNIFKTTQQWKNPLEGDIAIAKFRPLKRKVDPYLVLRKWDKATLSYLQGGDIYINPRLL